MEIFFSTDAFLRIMKEVMRWYQIGLQKEKKPYESVGFPLSFTKLKDEKSPVDVISFSDVSRIVIAYIAIPPDWMKNYSPASANFKKPGGDPEKASRTFYDFGVKPYLRRFPKLEIISRLHSHPSGLKKNSGGDLRTIAGDEINSRSAGYGFSLSFILVPQGKVPDWGLKCFSVNNAGFEKELNVQMIDHGHKFIREAKSRPFYSTPLGIAFEKTVEEYMAENFENFARKRLNRGWTSWSLLGAGQETIILIPPSFPLTEPHIYCLKSEVNWRRETESPGWLKQIEKKFQNPS